MSKALIEKAFEKWVNNILEEQGLTDWTVKFNTGGGLCVRSKKEIWLTSPTDNPFALFLHEVAHALIDEKYDIEMGDKTGHHAIFADKYTSLVKQYMTPSYTTWQREQLEAEIKDENGLLPCPFCGGKGKPESYLSDGERFFYVQCSKCSVEVDARCIREQASFDAWNTRRLYERI